MKSKTIILSSSKKYESNSPRAILTLIADSNYVDGKIRLYNMTDLTKGTKLGIYYNKKVISSSLVKDRDAYNFKLNQSLDLDKDIYCALVDTLNKNDVVLSGGNDLGFCFTDEEDEQEDNLVEIEDDDELNILDDDEQCNKDCKNCVYKKFFYNHQDFNDHKFDNSSQDCFNKDIDKNPDYLNEKHKTEDYDNLNTDCTKEKYPIHKFKNLTDLAPKQDYDTMDEMTEQHENHIESDYHNLFDKECLDYENFEYHQNQRLKNINLDQQTKTNNFSSNSNNEKSLNNEQEVFNNETENFLNSIAEQLDEMFLTYPIDEEIMKIIPNSKIVKITDSVDDSSYIVGVIYQNDRIQILIYGVPSKYNTPPPQELGDNYQWLAVNPDDPMSDGYYLIYQDASNGRLIPI